MLILQYSDNVFTDDNMSVSTSNRDSRSNPGLSNNSIGTSPRRYKLRKGQLSEKYGISLTEVICLTQEPKVNIRFSPDDATEHL